MDNDIVRKLVTLRQQAGRPVEFTVYGTSMSPVLNPGDTISIRKQEQYLIGDILVFYYKHDELLVHRLLQIRDNTYFCKGDNAFRLEDIKEEQVLGKVVMESSDENIIIYRIKIHILCFLSLQINKAFVRSRYCIEKTKNNRIYKIFKNLYLHNVTC